MTTLAKSFILAALSLSLISPAYAGGRQRRVGFEVATRAPHFQLGIPAITNGQSKAIYGMSKRTLYKKLKAAAGITGTLQSPVDVTTQAGHTASTDAVANNLGRAMKAAQPAQAPQRVQ